MARFKVVGKLWRSTKEGGKAKASGFIDVVGLEVRVLLMPNEKRSAKDADFTLVHVVEDDKGNGGSRTSPDDGDL